MKILLSALASFAVGGGAVAPLTMINNTNNKTVATEPLKEVNVDLNGLQQITVDQGGKSWTLKFDLGSETSMDIHKIQFHGGGLKSYVAWGSDVWNYGWPVIDVIDDAETHTIFRDDHTDGLARQTSYLNYTLNRFNLHEFELKFDFFTMSYNSFSGSWGTLTIGDALTLIE